MRFFVCIEFLFVYFPEACNLAVIVDGCLIASPLRNSAHIALERDSFQDLLEYCACHCYLLFNGKCAPV